MYVVILAGGKGVRYSSDKPKALAVVGNKPIIHHLMDFYDQQGYNNFILALGWKQEEIINYFKSLPYFGTPLHRFKITFVDTGQETHTGKRLKLIEHYIPKDNENFFVNYVDGLSNVNLTKLYERHMIHKNISTLTAVRPTNQFGELIFDNNDNVIQFEEKPKLHSYINGGFFIFNRKIFNYIDENKNQELEKDILVELAQHHQLGAYKHDSFWQTLNTAKDEIHLNNIYRDCEKQNKEPIWLRIK
ncbi:MAG: sugar phosphate nucleotidyltransferase [Candidatus Dojkabacteria bacterium]|nr:sugar phosphate nucleotidyltransferase [Candidatus Dojkabacteria bacterium]